MDSRTVVVVAALVLLGGGAWWASTLQPDPGEPGVHAVIVVAPDGSILRWGLASVERATPLQLLLALGNPPLDVGVEQTSFPGCSSVYVRSIGPYAETATGGWNYYTRQPGGEWEWQSAGADCGIPSGVEVEWCWVERDVCEHHAEFPIGTVTQDQ